MEFHQIDVFVSSGAYTGNPLAVFPEPGQLSTAQMQAIASEMNLSETTFVVGAAASSYDVRIFTPQEELPFAGHPTLGTAWVLRSLGTVTDERLVQRSAAGETKVRSEGDVQWLEREGEADSDLEDSDPRAPQRVARALGIEPREVGLEARELGRAGRLRPAVSSAGLRQLMVPLADVGVLSRCEPRADLLSEIAELGMYCYTAVGAGKIRARGFFPGAGVPEDPATGSAAAALGIHLAARLGPIEASIEQGVEIGRPSRILLRSRPGHVEVGGRCEPVLSGRLERLP
jgi:trans-2,3-dihydro-3-hydroxyanthranilate isomerase